jgi:hypothetical protein
MLMSHTNLDASEAAALAQEVLSSVPYEVRAESSQLSVGIVEALMQCGADVLVDGDGSR